MSFQRGEIGRARRSRSQGEKAAASRLERRPFDQRQPHSPPPPARGVPQQSITPGLGGLRLTHQPGDAQIWLAASLPLFEQHPQQVKRRHDHHGADVADFCSVVFSGAVG